MILRSLSKNLKHHNWSEFFIEFILIIVGVFFALQVDNWNEERERLAKEKVAIERLIIEYTTNLSVLAGDKVRHEGVIESTEVLLGLFSPNPELSKTEKELSELLMGTLQNPVFVPRLGTTNSLISSGDLRLIDDGDLQAGITEWPARAEELISWQVVERHHGEELILGESFEYIAYPDLIRLVEADDKDRLFKKDSNFDNDFVGFFSSRNLEGLYSNRLYNNTATIRRITELENDTRLLIDKLKQRLNLI